MGSFLLQEKHPRTSVCSTQYFSSLKNEWVIYVPRRISLHKTHRGLKSSSEHSLWWCSIVRNVSIYRWWPYVYWGICTYLYINICVYINIYTHICTYTYSIHKYMCIYKHIHTYVHIHVQSPVIRQRWIPFNHKWSWKR